MELTIKNSKEPEFCKHDRVAEFRLVIWRDGDKVVLKTPRPRCFRSWRQFTKTEKAAYNAILTHVVETAPGAFKGAEVKSCE
jgi:hypothetical protein